MSVTLHPPPAFRRLHVRGVEVLRLRPALTSYWRSLVGMALVFLLWRAQREIFDAATALFGLEGRAPLAGLLLGWLPFAGYMAWHRMIHVFELEDGRTLRRRVGLIAHETREFALSEKIQIDVSQTVMGRLLGFGTVAFWTGDDRSRLTWTNVKAPEAIRRYVNALREAGAGTSAFHAPAPRVSTSAPVRVETRDERPATEPPEPLLPPIVAPTLELLARDEPVWVPLCTPHVDVCAIAFHPAGHDHREHATHRPRTAKEQHDYGFRIKRWLKTPGDFVQKNEPIAVVDGSRARGNPVLSGLALADPVIYAPESGRLAWRSDEENPYYLFGLIHTTHDLIEANMEHAIRSDLVPFVEAIIAHLSELGPVRSASLALRHKGEVHVLAYAATASARKMLQGLRGQLLERCHLFMWRTPPANWRAPEWGKATAEKKEQLRQRFLGPPSGQYQDAWAKVTLWLRDHGADFEKAGLAFAVPADIVKQV